MVAEIYNVILLYYRVRELELIPPDTTPEPPAQPKPAPVPEPELEEFQGPENIEVHVSTLLITVER